MHSNRETARIAYCPRHFSLADNTGMASVGAAPALAEMRKPA